MRMATGFLLVATCLILCVAHVTYAQSQNVLNGTVGVRTTTSQKRAREIMGRNMFGVEEATKHFRMNPSKAQLLALSKIPFSEQTLDVCKDTHVLVAVFPLSILEIRGRVSRKLHLFYDEQWYQKELFANDRDGAEWQLVRKTPIPNSIEMKWQEQQALLAQNEEVPTARVMIYTLIGHFLATGERLLKMSMFAVRIWLPAITESTLAVSTRTV